jgi:hypothetical protein
MTAIEETGGWLSLNMMRNRWGQGKDMMMRTAAAAAADDD